MKEELPLQTILQTRQTGKYIYVQAFSYEEAQKWFNDNIIQPGIPAEDIQVEIGENDRISVIRIENIEDEDLTFLHPESNAWLLRDALTKGYDYNSGSYVFTMVDFHIRTHQVPAPTPNDALRLINEGKYILDENIEEVHAHEVLSCRDDVRMVIDGEVIDIHSDEDLEEELRKQYPKGVEVLLESESVENLLKYETSDEETEWIAVKGMIDADADSRMAGAYGKLDAKLVLTPDDYDLLEACDQTYYSDELSDWGLDAGMNATSVMLSTEDCLKDARIQAGVCPAMLHCLYINGQPYSNIMKMIHDHHITDDDQLLHLLNTEFIAIQPEWLQKMAKDAARPEIQKFWVEKMGPVYKEERTMFDKTMEQAAKENGYESLADYKRDCEWSKNPSPQLVEKMARVQQRWHELYQPYRNKSQEVAVKKEQLEHSLMKNFISRFNDRQRQMVSEVKVIQRGSNDFAVRCKLNGEQQSGRIISKEDGEKIVQSTNKAETLKEIAGKYFREEIAGTFERTREQARHR